MRLFFSLSVLAAATVGAASFACSGADTPAPITEDAAPPFSSSTSGGDSGPPPASSTELPNRPPDGGGGGGDGGGGGGNNPLCQNDSIREMETNNDLATANKVEAKTLTYCGRVTKGNPDHVKFTMPAKQWFFSDPETSGGATNLALFIDGQEQDLGDIPLKVGSEYVVRISTDADGDVAYRMPMRFE